MPNLLLGNHPSGQLGNANTTIRAKPRREASQPSVGIGCVYVGVATIGVSLAGGGS